ncbi:MAG: tRNA (guanine(10)-N(2))-dimethyltransferase [Thermoplasmata archaeon]|nr:MAG: tRNA (guanine(10)-N(2))-dimethyltransferase [Thermoplasmata archaeon]
MKKKLGFFETVTEGSTSVFVYKSKESKKGPGSKQDGVFYNPAMELNRDLSILICQWLINNSKNKVKLLDGLAASGIRGFRMANELEGSFEVFINDYDEKACFLIKKNQEEKKYGDVKVYNKNLNVLLSEESFDYIDVDPFGSPVSFIDSAARGIKNNGILGCTATDTATLCGVYPRVCIRRYGAVPFYSVVMKEIGLRILLGFICREVCKYDKGITPLVCYATDHYFRVYVRVKNGVKYANDSMEKIGVIKQGNRIGFEKNTVDVGPLWLGKIQYKKIFSSLRTISSSKKLGTKNVLWKLFDLLEEEADASCFFYTTDSLSSFFKTSPPKMETVFDYLKSEGFDVFHTHFSPVGFKTNAGFEVIEKMFKTK